ncbi:MAG TPA: GNAT family N-acetyltransferase [Streptosporangiaceae bacterium]|jgi:RimJ/RimL family protein N-acetyltransferase|nr:GNAT family N-acetyltransferase [Streptosporangiaceae bacterium]
METVIRAASPADASGLLELQATLDRETRFMLLEPGERAADPTDLRDRLARQTRQVGRDGEADPADPSFTLVGYQRRRPVGYVDVSVPRFRRARRTGSLVMGVLAAHTGRGLGRALLLAATDHARDRDMHRLELTVMTHNRRAFNLYLSVGFLVEGVRRAALRIDDGYVDEYYMGLLL